MKGIVDWYSGAGPGTDASVRSIAQSDNAPNKRQKVSQDQYINTQLFSCSSSSMQPSTLQSGWLSSASSFTLHSSASTISSNRSDSSDDSKSSNSSILSSIKRSNFDPKTESAAVFDVAATKEVPATRRSARICARKSSRAQYAAQRGQDQEEHKENDERGEMDRSGTTAAPTHEMLVSATANIPASAETKAPTAARWQDTASLALRQKLGRAMLRRKSRNAQYLQPVLARCRELEEGIFLTVQSEE